MTPQLDRPECTPRTCSNCWRSGLHDVRERLVSNVLHTVTRYWCDRCVREFRNVEPVAIVEDAA